MPSGARERGGASTKGDHHVVTAYADDRGHHPGRVGCWNAAAPRPGGLPIGGALSPFAGPAQRGGSTSLPACARTAQPAARSKSASTGYGSCIIIRSAAAGGCSGKNLNRVHFGTVGFPLGQESRRSHMAIFVRTRLFQISATS